MFSWAIFPHALIGMRLTFCCDKKHLWKGFGQNRLLRCTIILENRHESLKAKAKEHNGIMK